MIKLIVILLSVLPLCLQGPYLYQAWSSSRLDHYDWIFYLTGVVSVFYAVRKEKFGKCDFFALFLLIPMLLLTFGGSYHHINALSAASGVGVIFAAVWLLGAWRLAYCVLPSVFIMLLGTPSSSYQLSLLLMCPVWAAWLVKFILALCCLIWIWCSKYYGYFIKCGTLWFVSAVLASGFLLLHTKELYFEGKSFTPEFAARCGDFWGRSIQIDANTKRFFATSTAKQYRYTRNNIDISVLAVQCGSNIHEIHPASHCLRTSLWTVHSEKILYLQDNFAVTEIDAEKGMTRILVWVWYSSDKISTPNFLGFRRHFRSNGKHFTYQISVPVYGDVQAGRSVLQEFFQQLQKEAAK